MLLEKLPPTAYLPTFLFLSLSLVFENRTAALAIPETSLNTTTPICMRMRMRMLCEHKPNSREYCREFASHSLVKAPYCRLSCGTDEACTEAQSLDFASQQAALCAR
ncbi:hypothetical protein COCSADRAFT_23670 [Bipolaris sorokiniana ND90Pr]|uniref:Extracellular membrane protein CFEM domain-containing protein n=1 Tax=Cochliobolus sativus (strain ND90Pr / ATCC 201652) TaxID=665912 RepID=M2SY65_COCSN|nr:uncharacterized protein COCSADRAFT_23670 [Bipolaris sorokiniana ND90Pr]EMD67270.1 hypothetical protein COCSADRAFT_23670 [Bipolaris sorokiniana ND90Pr]